MRLALAFVLIAAPAVAAPTKASFASRAKTGVGMVMGLAPAAIDKMAPNFKPGSTKQKLRDTAVEVVGLGVNAAGLGIGLAAHPVILAAGGIALAASAKPAVKIWAPKAVAKMDRAVGGVFISAKNKATRDKIQAQRDGYLERAKMLPLADQRRVQPALDAFSDAANQLDSPFHYEDSKREAAETRHALRLVLKTTQPQ